MKSVGEVMGIGRSFQEALQSYSIIRNKRNGLGADGRDIPIMNKLSRN
jgi:carbamoyl-phosphate synthase large subunit